MASKPSKNINSSIIPATAELNSNPKNKNNQIYGSTSPKQSSADVNHYATAWLQTDVWFAVNSKSEWRPGKVISCRQASTLLPGGHNASSHMGTNVNATDTQIRYCE